MKNNRFIEKFDRYASWRQEIARALGAYQRWLVDAHLADTQIEQRMTQLLNQLREDKLNVAFVAEFSRGKSELINAIFFSGYGQRLLPSGVGRTTMCPTELRYDADKPISLSLLSIETNARHLSISDYRRMPQAWTVIEFDANSRESMVDAFNEVNRVRRVTAAQAEALGLYDPTQDAESMHLDDAGMMEIPCWRYAVINFPHPMLKQGLVILDTPGLNAIGAEPELTMSMLPNAHAVLFVLGADTGVTKSEIEVWRRYISGQRWKLKGRMAVLNKIDGLWDALKSEDEIEAELHKQLKSTADLLGLSVEQIIPTSAQKGLLAKVNGDQGLLQKSRLLQLERTLSDTLIPAKQEIIRENIRLEVDDLMLITRNVLQTRLNGVFEQTSELRALQGKNQNVVAQMMEKVKLDKASFEADLRHYHAMRSVLVNTSNQLFHDLGMAGIKAKVRETRDAMIKAAFTKTLRRAMDNFFVELKSRMQAAEVHVLEINSMMQATYTQFASAHAVFNATLPAFTTAPYLETLHKLETIYQEEFDTPLNMIAHEKLALTNKFFETLACHVVMAYETANRDAECWLKTLVAPMESQLREHHLQLKRRIESIRRIYQTSDTIEARMTDLTSLENVLRGQLEALASLHETTLAALSSVQVAVAVEAA